MVIGLYVCVGVTLLCERGREEEEKGGYEGKKRIEDTKEEDKGKRKKCTVETKRVWSEGVTIYNFITNRRQRGHLINFQYLL